MAICSRQKWKTETKGKKMQFKYFEGSENYHKNAKWTWRTSYNLLQLATLPIWKTVLEFIPSESVKRGLLLPHWIPSQIEGGTTHQPPQPSFSKCQYLSTRSNSVFHLTEAWYFEWKGSFWMLWLFSLLTRWSFKKQ